MIRTVLVLTAVALVAAALGCGGGPSSPSTVPDAGFSGVTLSGTFQGSGSARGSSLVAFASTLDGDGITVVVFDSDGNEVGRIDVVDGRFTIRGLPTGTFTALFFDDSGTELGSYEFDGVRVNQEIDIVLEMDSSGEVVVVEERRTGIDHDEIELEGVARNITIGDDPMSGSLEVNGHLVVTRSAETSIRKGNRALTLEDLDEGDRVHVRGVTETAEDGSTHVFAYEIKLQEEEDDGDGSTVAACDHPDPEKPGKILICHKGRTLSISPDAWPGHAGHGDTCGPCS